VIKLKNYIESRPSYFFTASTALAFVFVGYKSIYQSDRHLDNLLSITFLITFFSLSYYYKTTWSNWAGVALIFVLFFPPLYWLWRNGQYDFSVIAGIFPIQDMSWYYSDALLLHYGYPFSIFSSRRPLFTGYLSVILKLTDENLQFTLILFTLIIIISVIFLAYELKQSFGSITAMMVAVVLFYCYKGYGFTGKTGTEQLGLPLGILALALFLQGIRLKRNTSLLLGLLTLTLALNARAGAFFVIPAIILWRAYYNQDIFSKKQFGYFLGMVFLGFFLNFLISKIIGNSQGVLFENFAETFYGLATGYRGWTSLYIDHPGIRASEAWSLIIDIVRQNPLQLLLGIIRAYADYLSPETMFRFLYFAEQQSSVSYILYVCTFLGILRLFQMRSSFGYFLLSVFAGILISIPFAPPIDDGIRALTATIPFSALILAMPFAQITVTNADAVDSGFKQWLLSGYTLGLIVLCTIGPILIIVFAKPVPKFSSLDCSGTSIPVGISVKSGSFVRLIENEAMTYSLLPNLRVIDLRSSIAKNEMDKFNEGSSIFRRIEPNQMILAGHNLYNLSTDSKSMLVIVPTNIIDVGEINLFCANYLVTDQYGFVDIFLEQSLEPSDFLR
jgi:hypothetical protein